MTKTKYHVYGKYYNWTYNFKQAKRWASEWNGIVTVEDEKGNEHEV